MKYMGSKARIAKHILPIMLDGADEARITNWVEPFVGGANLIDKVPERFSRFGFDVNPHTIAALIAVRDYVEVLPESVSEEEYKALKGKEASPIESWIRFGCSFGGKFENGYARDLQGIPPRNHAAESKHNAQKQSPFLQTVRLTCASYETLSFTNSLVYCDPPYSGVTGYKTDKFNHSNFFNWCKEQKARGNIVFVSEYEAPFEIVWEGQVKTNFASNRKTATHKATERLYRV